MARSEFVENQLKCAEAARTASELGETDRSESDHYAALASKFLFLLNFMKQVDEGFIGEPGEPEVEREQYRYTIAEVELEDV